MLVQCAAHLFVIVFQGTSSLPVVSQNLPFFKLVYQFAVSGRLVEVIVIDLLADGG